MRRPRSAVGVGVAGLGRIGRLHATNLAARVSGVTLVSVADADAQVAAKVGTELAVPFTTSFDELLAHRALDAVVIATPAALHAEMIETAARAGKHVFCEKPLADDVSAAEAAVLAAHRAGVSLQIGFQMRWDRDLRAAADRLASGELGRVLAFRTTLRDVAPPTREYLRRSAGFFADGAVHTLDLARWLGGEMTELTAFGVAVSDPVFEELGDLDNTVIVVKFAAGGLGTLENSRVSGYGFDANTEVMAEHGTLRIGHDRRRHVQLLRNGSVTVDYVTDFLERFHDAYVLELEGFGAAVREAAPVTPDGIDGLVAVGLCRAAARSHSLGGATVSVAGTVETSSPASGERDATKPDSPPDD
jgi:predicted dehydrogenase